MCVLKFFLRNVHISVQQPLEECVEQSSIVNVVIHHRVQAVCVGVLHSSNEKTVYLKSVFFFPLSCAFFFFYKDPNGIEAVKVIIQTDFDWDWVRVYYSQSMYYWKRYQTLELCGCALQWQIKRGFTTNGNNSFNLFITKKNNGVHICEGKKVSKVWSKMCVCTCSDI